MQAVILAAGQGRRLRPITDDIPKAMVPVLGKPLLEHVFNSLPSMVTELVVIVGYRGEQIRNHFGDEWNGKPIVYVEQDTPQGTAHALFTARPAIKDERFLILPGDNVSEFSSLEEGLEHDYVVFAYEHEHPERFGVIELNEDGKTLRSIQEKPENPPTNLISTASMVLSPGIFDCKLVKHERIGEYFIPDLLMQFTSDTPIYVERQKYWFAIDYPEDIPKVEKALKQHL